MTTSARPAPSAGVEATSLYEERLVDDVLLLREVLAACACDDAGRLMDLGVLAPC
jgi:hypothetical protein